MRNQSNQRPRRLLPALALCVTTYLLFTYLANIIPLLEKTMPSSTFLCARGSSDIIGPTLEKPVPSACLPIYDVQHGQWITIQKENTRECLLDEPKSDYIRTLILFMVGTPLGGKYKGRRSIGKFPLNYEENLRFQGRDWPPFGYTMIGKARMENFRCAIEEVNRNGIPGAVAELGVWRGGAMMMAAAIGKESGFARDLYLFDVFDAIGAYNGVLTDYLSTKVEDVKESFQYYGLDSARVHFEKGLFQETLPAWKEKNISLAVLRVDGNFYDSYQDAMYYLYSKVPVGGIVIFDDIVANPSVMRFWNDFKKEQGLPEELNRADWTGTWFRKEKEVQIDWKYFRPPQDVNKEREEKITCGCKDTCNETALSKRTQGVPFTCKERITYLMTTYSNDEIEACSGAVENKACGEECDPEKCSSS